jgi:hypothetical protein
MRRYHFIFLVLLGIFLIPDNAIACGSGKEKHACKKEVSSAKKEKKSCCESNGKSSNDNKGCEGNCGHSKCGCTSTCPPSSVSFLSEINFKVNMFNYSSIGKVKFSYATPSVSDGFYSIWLIPKIS